jgi:formate C-acetyltransferase
MSLAFQSVLERMSVIIRDEELIVGCRTSKLKGAPLFPENKIRWIEGDVDSFDERVVQRALITQEEKRILKDLVIPFWRSRTVEDRFEELLPEEVAEDMDKYIFTFMLEITYGIGHFTMNHQKVLAQGLSNIILEARQKKDQLTPEEKDGEKGIFYQALIRSMEAATNFADRYSLAASRMAEAEQDEERARELAEIAEVCARVPRHPARSFHEAAQSFYFIHLLAQIESGGNSISLGRIDQILYPYYRADIDSGRITEDRARELMALLYLKTNEIWNVLEEAYIPGGEGPEGKTTQNVTVGGLGVDGEDATNELSLIALEAFALVSAAQPNFGVRISAKTDDQFLLRALEYARLGVPLHFFNDDSIVKTLLTAGHTLEDARDYGVVGCLEPNAQGKTFGSTFAVQFSGIKCLEFALSNGIDNIFGLESGLRTGNPGDFKSFQDLWEAYCRQLSHFTDQFVRGLACLDQAIAEMVPSPFASAMIEGPMEKGLDLTKGGAVYNSTGVQFMGFSNVADSLFAIKRTVFDESVFSMDQIAHWLAQDWTDNEPQRVYMANKVPKYGNDIDEVDHIAAKVADQFCDELSNRRNFRNGAFWPGIFSVGFHLAMGAFTGASADGRSAGDPLGNGITPSNGAALKGPTAIANSVTKLPLNRIFNGCNLNMRFPGERIEAAQLLPFLRAYFHKGGAQVQFNMIDSNILRAAIQDPDKYRDLIIRVSGYSAIFVNLSDIAQEEIIERIEYNAP